MKPGLTVRQAEALSLVRGWIAEQGQSLEGPTPGPVCVHLASAVVAYENGEPSGVAYRVTPVESGTQKAHA